MSVKKIVIQEILFEDSPAMDGTRDMYYRGNSQIFKVDSLIGYFRLQENTYYDFFTYFNSLSIDKWKTYTIADHFALELDVKGTFYIDLMGHYIDKNHQIKKEWLGRYYYDLEEKEHIRMVYPCGINSMVVSFQIQTESECAIYGGSYTAMAEESDFQNPSITLATTTFKKEKYVQRNVEIMNNTVFSDLELSKHFNWIIVDNGNTLDPYEFKSEYINVVPNRNVGGSGGFCKGMMEALNQGKQVTHILLMDDDVCFMAESFRRVYMLLMLQKPKYKDYFISGAMLEISQRNIQHEDVGIFRLNGEHGPTKPRFDLNLWDSVIRNEEPLPEDGHQYSGWWFCCIPTTIARYDNLPLPFFIRGDDVEYSIRNHAKFISMNGICIWHEGFGTKFSGSMELYQVHRNDLILQAIHGHIADVTILERIKNLFWEELFKFNYKACNLLLESIEDYLKGPEFIKKLDGEACMREKKAEDNQLLPLTDEVKRKIGYDPERLYEGGPLAGMALKMYGHFVNGHKLPQALAGKRIAVIPYGWGYSQSRLYRAGTVYAVDPINEIYTVYKRDVAQYRNLTKRYDELLKRYDAENKKIVEQYREAEQGMESKSFWDVYLQ